MQYKLYLKVKTDLHTIQVPIAYRGYGFIFSYTSLALAISFLLCSYVSTIHMYTFTVLRNILFLLILAIKIKINRA
jgi:hypothetical protein